MSKKDRFNDLLERAQPRIERRKYLTREIDSLSQQAIRRVRFSNVPATPLLDDVVCVGNVLGKIVAFDRDVGVVCLFGASHDIFPKENFRFDGVFFSRQTGYPTFVWALTGSRN